MKAFVSNYPLVRLPATMEQTLFLIGEELKSRKLFEVLSRAGLGDSFLQPRLDQLILRDIGLDNSDETFEIYTRIMDKRSKKIREDNESISRQALKAYQQLISEKSKLKVK